MKKLNKVLFGFGSIAAVVAPVAAVVACDDDTPAAEVVVGQKSAKVLAAKHIAMWETVQWADDAVHTKGVSIIASKTEADVKTSVNAFFAEINKISSEIKWDKVKALLADETKYNAAKKLIEDTVKELDAAKVNVATGVDLLKLAYKTNVLYQNYIPLVAISFGKESADAQAFTITVLEGHSSNGVEVKDAASYKTYVDGAKAALEAKLQILGQI